MYHIKPDKRSQTSAGLIVKALYECLCVKDFPSITISDIQRASSVSRATFYRLFDNLSDILRYECNNVFEEMLHKYRNESHSTHLSPFENMFSYFFSYWMEHIDLLNALSDSGRIDIMNSVYLDHAEEIGALIGCDETMSNGDLKYFVSIATGAIFGLFYAWIRNDRRETLESLLRLMRKSLHLVCKTLDD